MRTMGLCILTFCLVSVSLAQEQDRPVDNTSAAVQKLSSDAEFSKDVQLRDYDRDVLADRSADCAFIRTYRVRREHTGSDVVRPASYRTCIPTKRFELKTAVEVEPAPSAR